MSFFTTNSEEEAREYLPRYRLCYTAVAIVGVAVFLRLWYLQIISGEELRFFSEKNRIKASKMRAPRGSILDRDGRILVDNTPGFEVTITPQYAKKMRETVDAVAKVLNTTSDNVKKIIEASIRKDGPYTPVRVKENLSRDEVARLEVLRIDHPGLDINMINRRNYILGPDGAQLFGYVGEISKNELPRLNQNLAEKDQFQKGDWIGKTGLEYTYDKHVRGLDGLNMVQVDALGRETTLNTTNLLGDFKQVDPTAGNNIQLTIDREVQNAMWKSLNSQQSGGLGAGVALEISSGEILAWTSSPAYDPNEFATGISAKLWGQLINDIHRPMRNKVIQDHSPPGSTFKPLMALAALQEKEITTSTTFHCPGYLQFGKKRYNCWKKEGHGAVNVYAAIEQSCDVFFYKVGLALGIDRMAKYAKAIGIGLKTGVNLRGEAAGLMPTSQWKEKTTGEPWQLGENLSNAIGQGFVLTTPLQLATAYSVVANMGKAYKPFVVKRLLDNDKNVVKEFKPELLYDVTTPQGNSEGVVISKETLDTVREGLRLVGNGAHGTAKSYQIPGVEIAGKTGTVQLFSMSSDEIFKKCENRPLLQRHHGWFVGYAPANDPKIVAAVWAEHACHGATAAAPAVRDTIKAYMEKYYPDMLKKDKDLKKSMKSAFYFEPKETM